MLKYKKSILFATILSVFMLSMLAIAQNTPSAGRQAGLGAAGGAVAGRGDAAGRGGPGGRGPVGMNPVDNRVQQRTYLFKDTNETLPYSLYVPSKYSKDKKSPLVLALHGLSGNHTTFMRAACVNEAEKGGFILVSPMGYSPNGSFGMPFAMGGRGRRSGPGGPNTPGRRGGAPGAVFGEAPQQGVAQPGRGTQPGGRGTMARGPAVGGTKETDPAKVTEYSEKDAMNVLEMVRKGFNVDDRRIYLMGHSLGGGGALHMGEQYASIWAGVAAIAPAAFGFQGTANSKLKDVPLLIIQGDGDTLIQPAGSQRLAEQLKSLNFQCEYKLLAGFDHGSIIGGAMPDVFKFFNQHIKGEPKK